MRSAFSRRLPALLVPFILFSPTWVPRLAAQQKTLAPEEFRNWLPISDEERALKAPRVEKDAGAEVLLWRVRVVDEVLGNRVDLQRVLYNYVRVKIFDDKGKEKASTVDLAYRDPGAILSVAGRTIQPDGTILELDKKAIQRRDLVRAGRASEKAVSFAMPGVEPGSIIEYRWKQTEDDNRFRYFRLHFQRDLPVEQVTYYVKPLSDAYGKIDTLYMQAFHCSPSPIKMDNEGWDETSVENLPALHTEPYAPSQPNLEQWALLYYRENDTRDSKKFWDSEGKKLYKELKESLKLSDDLKAAANDAVSGATSDADKIDRLGDYLRKHVRVLGDPEVTSAEVQQYVAKFPKGRARTATEILKSGLASDKEMNVAFAALATAAGMDVRTALVADRTDIAFSPKTMMDRYFLDRAALAVRDDKSWKFVDVSQKLIAPGSLPWEEEGVYALITDPKDPEFVTTPMSPASASLDQNIATLHLEANGSLTGNVETEYTGHRAEAYRSQLQNEAAAQREEWFRDRISHMFPESEVTLLAIENVNDPRKPLRITYHLSAPGFAQVTGKRILFQPNVFRRAVASPFTASERKTVIEFPFAWKEVDQIKVFLPEGFSIENADNPGSLNLGSIGSYKLDMTYTKGTPLVWTTKREFTFGEGGNLYLDPPAYPQLKRIFDTIHTHDMHSIALKAN